MCKEKLQIDKMYRPVSKLRDLGTGRDHTRVLVGDRDDARTTTFWFEGNVHQNWPSSNKVTIKTDDGRKTLDIATQMVCGKTAYSFLHYGKPAYIFLWNELTAPLWSQQIEREK